MSIDTFVLHSAPTLAGIKTGSLFTIQTSDQRCLYNEIRHLNVKLSPKGVRIIPLHEINDSYLIYVYRPRDLQKDFKNKQLIEMLEQLQYPTCNTLKCLICLSKRLKEYKKDKSNSGFPHEIGLFLGYPPEDVKGFIDNKATNYKVVGTWKVYGDKNKAENRFMQYRRCIDDYYKRVRNGDSLENLTVS